VSDRGAAGVPVIVHVFPATVSVAHVGRVPVLTVQVYGPEPPVKLTTPVYAWPTIAAGRLVVVISNLPTIGTLNACVAVAGVPCESTTLTVKLFDPTVVGVPVRAPVAAFTVNPAGSVPAEMLKVYGATPPVTTTV
jgi:hypothetical protein